MPSDCREVRPRNFPPRLSSGASRRFFSATCLLAALATMAVAGDRALTPAAITAATERAPAPHFSFTRPPILPPAIRLSATAGDCPNGPLDGARAVMLSTFEEPADGDASAGKSTAENLPPPEAKADLQAANDFGLKPMSAMSIDIVPPRGEGGHPEDFAAARFAREPTLDPAQNVGRPWALTDYRWEASMLCHAPLLFEQVNADRYGITYGCLQPMISGAHFFATVPALPYKVWANGHDERQYALGYYRPGSYAQPQCYKPRISADASLFEAGAILGLIYVLP